MPKELRDVEQFQKLMTKAVEMRVVRQNEVVKLKLRTPDYLYTFKTNEDEADDLIKGAKDLEVIEFSATKKGEKKEKKEEEEEKAEKKEKKSE